MLKCKLGSSTNARVYSHVMAALCNCRTEPSICDSVTKVIEAAASPEKAKYIRNN